MHGVAVAEQHNGSSRRIPEERSDTMSEHVRVEKHQIAGVVIDLELNSRRTDDQIGSWSSFAEIGHDDEPVPQIKRVCVGEDSQVVDDCC